MPDPTTAALGALEEFRKVGAVAAMQQTQQFTGVVFRGGSLVAVDNFMFGGDAARWFDSVLQEPHAFTYAAYFDKQSSAWPLPIKEEVGTATA